MKSLTSSAASCGQRNASLLSAFALMLAFAFGVSGATVSFGVATQQLLPDEGGRILLADLPEPHDPVIVAYSQPLQRVSWVAVRGGREVSDDVVLPPLRFFSARAPPVLTA